MMGRCVDGAEVPVAGESLLSGITRITPSEYQRAAEVLARAFEDNPQWVALNPDRETRRARLPAMFLGAIRLTAAAGGIPERTADGEAVALWLCPGADIGFRSIMRSGWLLSARWMLRPPYNIRSKMAVLRTFEHWRKELMPDPHWYLMALGVDPVHHGRGFGPMLVLAGIQRADRDGAPMYVETETDPNEAMYEKLGFATAERITIPEIDIGFSLMVRQPRPVPGS